MTKILPVTGTNTLKKIKKLEKPVQDIFINNSRPPFAPSLVKVAAATVGSLLPLFSCYDKSFADNYFQLSINPEDDKPYKADVFQKAAAMNLYDGKDVLVTAPTGIGKTAIAKYVITKNLQEGKKTFYTTPLKALSNEKYLDFCKTYGSENVGILTGDTKINPDAKIIVMTTEIYRNMAAVDLFNFHKEQKNKGIPDGLKTIIFDELQYLGDVDRGGIWEQAIMFTPPNVQVLSLSATIGNNLEINDWLANIKWNKSISVMPEKSYMPKSITRRESILINVPSKNRHVPLDFEVLHVEAKTQKKLDKKQTKKSRSKKSAEQQPITAIPRRSEYVYVTNQLLQEDKLPAIYFVFSKKECKQLLQYLSEEGDVLTTTDERKQISSIIEEHIQKGNYLGENLNMDALMKGYAIHNAGLLPSQKTLIEELFQKKLIKVVLATETLSAGINMPARTTVISSPRKPSSTSDELGDHKRNLTPNEFHQMAGRAGRRGIDTRGYCYLLSCNKAQNKFYNNIVTSPPNRLDSNMDFEYSFIASYMTEYKDETELERILSKSLYAYDKKTHSASQEKIQEMMNVYHTKKDILLEEKFITPTGELTQKGEMLKGLNGYAQIPIINLLMDKKLAKLTPAEIAGIAGGMANIKLVSIDDSDNDEMQQLSTCDLKCFAQELDEYVSRYNYKSASLHKDKEFIMNNSTIEHLYSWADLNTEEEDSRQSWKIIMQDEVLYGVNEEGTLFKEITQTADLIKQLIKVAHQAEKLASDKEDSYYFQTLAQKLREALNLIQREPIRDVYTH